MALDGWSAASFDAGTGDSLVHVVTTSQQLVDVTGTTPALLVVGLALALAAVHVFTPEIVAFDSLPRPPMLSFGSGVSVAYVFAHLLPKVDHASETVVDEAGLLPWGLSIYVVVLAGFVAFYGLEHVVRRARESARGAPSDGFDGVFWLHIGSFATYNALLGHLLAERTGEPASDIVLYAAAIGLHFLVNDHSLREHHEQSYHHVGRWVLAGAVVVGAVSGIVVHVEAVVLDVLVSLLAGAIVLNVIKEELPSEREARFSAFLFGILLYTALLAAM